MSDRLRLPSRYRQQVEDILRENMPRVEAWAYGSRVNGESHEASDLDLALRAPGLRPIPSADMEALREAFRESNIPIIVDARDWSKLPESFHQEIERDYVSITAEG